MREGGESYGSRVRERLSRGSGPVMSNSRRANIVAASMFFLLVGGAARAEDVEKRLRLSFAIGGSNTEDKVPSDAANFMTVVREDGSVAQGFEDPRQDTAQLGSLAIKPAIRYNFAAQFAFTKHFVLEGAVGYQKGDVGEIDVQGQFSGDLFDSQREAFNFRSFRQPGGVMTQVPVQLTALFRFRPKATYNPYAGLGIGYTFVGFTPSRELNELSLNLDNAEGSFAAQGPFPAGFGSPFAPEQMTGATVEAPDTFEWHGVGGMEWTIKKKWAIFADLRYTFASKPFRLGFNNGESLGVSVPSGQKDFGSPEATRTYGTYFIASGLIDVGCLVPIESVGTEPCAPPGGPLACDPQLATNQPGACKLQFTPDGQPDSGFYYVKGGEINFGGPTLQIGIRYTF